MTGAGFFLDAAFFEAVLLVDFPTGLKPGRFFFTFLAWGTKETAAAGDDMVNSLYLYRSDEVGSFALNQEQKELLGFYFNGFSEECGSARAVSCY